jgi:ubiquinone/menaquinone biosynthesis C-methylase UbiE
MTNIEQLQKGVIREFSGRAAVQKYTREASSGLWGSERALISSFFPKGCSVLDVGCGTGRTTTPLLKMGYRVVGVDITPRFVQIAKRLNPVADFRVGDATKLEFPDESFDCALFSFNGWEQIPGRRQRQKALFEICRVLRKNGCFIFSSHIRSWKGYEPFWLKRVFQYYLLKPLGLDTEGIEFGDIFFERKSSIGGVSRQFTHISSLRSVKRFIKRAGFSIVRMGMRNAMAPKDIKLDSQDCMLYVCRK